MNQERVFKVLLGPHVTEKSAMPAGAATQVVFKVATDATKLEVKKAVEQLFDVQVDDVRVVNVKGFDIAKPCRVNVKLKRMVILSGRGVRHIGPPTSRSHQRQARSQ